MMTTRVMKKRIFTIQTTVNLNHHLGLFWAHYRTWPYDKKKKKKVQTTLLSFGPFSCMLLRIRGQLG